jgi:hypothetical protein
MTRTCSKQGCDDPIAWWNRSGVCKNCQTGRVIGEAPILAEAYNEDVSPEVILQIAIGHRYDRP